jgi:hypothetical protein
MRKFLKACKQLSQRMKKAFAKLLRCNTRSPITQSRFVNPKQDSALDDTPIFSPLSYQAADTDAAFYSSDFNFGAEEESLLSADSVSILHVGYFSNNYNSKKSVNNR